MSKFLIDVNARQLSLCLLSFIVMGLQGCVLLDQWTAQPALLVTATATSPTQKQTLDQALSQLLYAPAQVSDEVFLHRSTLLLARHDNAADHALVDAAQSLPEQIDLLTIHGQCVLKRLKTGKKVVLHGVACRAVF